VWHVSCCCFCVLLYTDVLATTPLLDSACAEQSLPREDTARQPISVIVRGREAANCSEGR
jgi:hypothetical protein